MEAYSLYNSSKGSTTPDQGRSSLHRYQRGYHQDSVANKGAGVLDLPGDMETCGQKSGGLEGTVDKSTRGQEVTTNFPEILAGQQATTVQGSGGGQQSPPGVRTK